MLRKRCSECHREKWLASAYCGTCFRLIFEFINGFHDTANAYCNHGVYRCFALRTAIIMSGHCELLAHHGEGRYDHRVRSADIQPSALRYFCCIDGRHCLNLFTRWFLPPSSSSHAFIGSLIGATIVFTAARAIFLGRYYREGCYSSVTSPLLVWPW